MGRSYQRRAYNSAVSTLKKELSIGEYRTIWLNDHSSKHDAREALLGAMGAMQEYQSRSKNSLPLPMSEMRNIDIEYLLESSPGICVTGAGYPKASLH
ncbi:hypothetical protein GGR53DRAFT_481996 [Hypoxylon sp. FL1150]|nr:hypothetical protein GGR53DRAFT_481996 [Hypoxylon sp. FL1150]